MAKEKEGTVTKIENTDKKPIVQKLQRCSFPSCFGEGRVLVSNLPFCRKHAEWADFFLWVAGKIKIKEDNITKSGLIIPK